MAAAKHLKKHLKEKERARAILGQYRKGFPSRGPLVASLLGALACGFVAAFESILAYRFEWFASPHGQAWLGCTECLRRSRALTLPSCDGTCGMSPFCRSPLTPRICEHIRIMNPVDFRTGVCLAPTENRASCRWRSDWHPCHPASQSSASMHSLLHFFTLPTDQRHEWRFAAGRAANVDWLDTWLAIRCGQFDQWAKHAAAMAVIDSLDAVNSPPVQRVGKSSELNCMNTSIDPKNQHRKASTHSARLVTSLRRSRFIAAVQ